MFLNLIFTALLYDEFRIFRGILVFLTCYTLLHSIEFCFAGSTHFSMMQIICLIKTFMSPKMTSNPKWNQLSSISL